MAAPTCIVRHYPITKTITYTFSAAVNFKLAADPYTARLATAMVASDYAFYKPALSGTYAAPAAGNVYTGAVIDTLSFNAGATILTCTYTGTFAAINPASFGYILFPILYKTYNAGDEEMTAANQQIFTSPTICPIADITAFETGVAFETALAVSASAGASITLTKQDEKCLLILQNTDSGNSEAVTIYKGDGMQGVADLTITLTASQTQGVVLESGRHKQIGLTNPLKGSYYLTASADVKVSVVELP